MSPAALSKEYAEIRFHGVGVDYLYGIYGVDVKKGAIAVVRPNGYIVLISVLNDTNRVHSYSKGCLVSASGEWQDS